LLRAGTKAPESVSGVFELLIPSLQIDGTEDALRRGVQCCNIGSNRQLVNIAEGQMDQILRRKQSFLLRLPSTLREQAARVAQNEGTSLNHFIGIALAEKISRMETEAARDSPYYHAAFKPGMIHPSRF
jgi:HicB family